MTRRLLVSVVVMLAWCSHVSAQNFDRSNFEFPDSLKTIYHAGVKMRDGVELATDVYLPDGTGKFPTLLVRDMYSNGTNPGRQAYAKFATANGYAFVFQSVRGRYDSDGNWYPYFPEINDGDDTLSWMRSSRGQMARWACSAPPTWRRCSGLRRSVAILRCRPSFRR